MFDGAIVIDGRSVRRAVRELGIRCDDKEIPEPIDDIKPQGWWIVADCSFHGTAWTRNQAGVRNGTVTVDVQTPAAFVVAGGRLAAILSPMATTEPALWLVTAASTLRQEAQGSQGLRHRGNVVRFLRRLPAPVRQQWERPLRETGLMPSDPIAV